MVSVARNGEEALDFLYRRGCYAGRPEGLPDLVLLDLNMLRVGGQPQARDQDGPGGRAVWWTAGQRA